MTRLTAEGKVTVMINGQPFEGMNAISYDVPREPATSAPVTFSGCGYSGSFEITKASSDRLLRWIDVATYGRYWLRRRDYLRGKQRRAIEPTVGRAWRRYRRNFTSGPAQARVRLTWNTGPRCLLSTREP